MITTYTYQNKTYDTLHEVSKALAKNCIFIPLSISDEALAELGVTVIHAEEPIENVKQRKIMELKRQRDAAEVEPIAYNGHGRNTMDIVMTMMTRHVIESMQLLLPYRYRARAQPLIGRQLITKMLKLRPTICVWLLLPWRCVVINCTQRIEPPRRRSRDVQQLQS